MAVTALIAVVAFTAGFALQPNPNQTCAESVDAVFSPGADDELYALLESANRSIDVELFQLSYEPLLNELTRAHERGIHVRVILEPRLEGDDNIEAASFLTERGVEVRWASLSFARTHSKFAVVDGSVVFAGSPNWSYSGMRKNREAALIVKGGSAVREFARVFEEDWKIAKPVRRYPISSDSDTLGRWRLE